MTLQGKTALVTGGTRGIGAAIVRRLVREGATVAFTYSHSADTAKQLESELGDAVKAYQADMRDAPALKTLAQTVRRDFGGIDILINNASTANDGLIGEIAQDDYDAIMRINVDGVFILTNEIAPHMSAGSRIINISSCLGLRAGQAGMSAYNASKFAVMGFTRS